GDHVVEAASSSLVELIQQGRGAWMQPRTASTRHALSTIRWHAPIPRPSKNVFCVGRNYISHIEEGARARGDAVKIPDIPVFFTKAPTSVTGPFDDIGYERAVTQQADWEAELAVI